MVSPKKPRHKKELAVDLAISNSQSVAGGWGVLLPWKLALGGRERGQVPPQENPMCLWLPQF